MNCKKGDRAQVVRGHRLLPCVAHAVGAVIKCGEVEAGYVAGFISVGPCWSDDWGGVRCQVHGGRIHVLPDECLKPLPPEGDCIDIHADVDIPIDMPEVHELDVQYEGQP